MTEEICKGKGSSSVSCVQTPQRASARIVIFMLWWLHAKELVKVVYSDQRSRAGPKLPFVPRSRNKEI